MTKLEGFYKVAENGRTYVTGIFFNPITKEEFSKTIYDYDDIRVEESAGELYSMEINEDVKKMWLHYNNVIQVGDLVQINRGRKFKGEQKRVVRMFTYKIDGMYGRSYGDVEYLVFDDNTKVAKHNCDLVQEPERYGVYEITLEDEEEKETVIVKEYEINENEIKLVINGVTYSVERKYFKEVNFIK